MTVLLVYYVIVIMGGLIPLSIILKSKEIPFELKRLLEAGYVTLISTICLLPNTELRPFALSGFVIGGLGVVSCLIVYTLHLLNHPLYDRFKKRFQV